MGIIVKPDYCNCILNTISSILNYYGANHEYATLSLLDKFFAGNYKNIVLMVFDGMGVDMLQHNLPADSFLRSNLKHVVTSVYPCTTTAAMTSYYSALSPNEHGWLGWSLYFKEFNGCVDIFTNQDSFTKESIGSTNAAYALMPYKTIYEMIDEAACSSVKSYTIIPPGIDFPEKANSNIIADSVGQICDSIEHICNNAGRKFVMSYWYEPDVTMHKEGCYDDKVRLHMEQIDKGVSAMCDNLKDTLLIITADHGLINVSEEVFLNEIPEIDECLIMPPSMESRAVSLFIKPEMLKAFEERFNRHFSNDFVLIPKEEVFKSGILGNGQSHKKVSDFVGDYLACATGDKMIRYMTHNAGEHHSFKSHHAGLTEEEMLVPLIVIDEFVDKESG